MILFLKIRDRDKQENFFSCFFKRTILSLSIFLSGCNHMLDTLEMRDETVLPPSYPIDNPPPPKSGGSIYQSGYEISLFQDNTAARIGDILTIRLEEATTGEKQAHTKSDKTSNYNTNAGTGTNQAGNVKPILFGGPLASSVFNLGTQMNFDGKGQTNEENKLQGTISVTVSRVLANGNLIIQGESWITINQGREYIRLTGIVRPKDIDHNNSISSQRIADARISYSGGGQVGNVSRGGIVAQFLYKYFPF